MEITSVKKIALLVKQKRKKMGMTQSQASALFNAGTRFLSDSVFLDFIGLLPEGNVKQRIAQDLHISELSTVKLLEALGGECAGTVSSYSSGKFLPGTLYYERQ